MLSALKRELKELVGQNEVDEVTRRLKEEVLREDCSYYDDTIMVQSRISGLDREVTHGTVAYDNKNITENSTSKALLWIINSFGVDDLKSSLHRSSKAFLNIPAYHAYSVDRVPQTEKFELDRYLAEDPSKKIHFYYLHGDSRQEVQSLANRLSLERNGRTLSAAGLKQAFSGKEPVFAAVKPEPRANSVLFHILMIKSLIEKFIGPVSNMNTLRQKTLKDLLSSPKLAPLGADDAVCILVTLDDYNWNKDVVVTVLRELYEKFCSVDLPDSAPHFYFFFGIEYKKENTNVRQEVEAVIEQRIYGEALDELLPVSTAHVCEWITRHPSLLAQGKEAEELVEQLFPNVKTLDMIDVEKSLKEVIDQHNKGLVL